MNTQPNPGVSAPAHRFYLTKKDLEAIKAVATTGSILAMKALAQAKATDPVAMPDEYVQWSVALDNASGFLREVDFHLKLAEQVSSHYSMTYNFTKQEVLALTNLRETVNELLELVNDLTKNLYGKEPSPEESAVLRTQILSLRTNYDYQSRAVRAFEEAFERESQHIMATGNF